MITCPLCHTEIPQVNIQPQIDCVYCPNGVCRNIFRWDDTPLKKQKMPPLPHIRITESGEGLHIAIHKPVKKADPVAFWGCLFTGWFLVIVPVVLLLMQAIGLSTLQLLRLLVASALICAVIPGSLIMKQKEKILRATLHPDMFSMLQDHLEYRDLTRDQRRIRAAYMMSEMIYGDETFYQIMVMADGPEYPVVRSMLFDEAVFITQAIKNYLNLNAYSYSDKQKTS